VRLVDNVDLVAAGDRCEERALPEVASVVDTTVAGRIDLDDVDIIAARDGDAGRPTRTAETAQATTARRSRSICPPRRSLIV